MFRSIHIHALRTPFHPFITKTAPCAPQLRGSKSHRRYAPMPPPGPCVKVHSRRTLGPQRQTRGPRRSPSTRCYVLAHGGCAHTARAQPCHGSTFASRSQLRLFSPAASAQIQDIICDQRRVQGGTPTKRSLHSVGCGAAGEGEGKTSRGALDGAKHCWPGRTGGRIEQISKRLPRRWIPGRLTTLHEAVAPASAVDRRAGQ